MTPSPTETYAHHGRRPKAHHGGGGVLTDGGLMVVSSLLMGRGLGFNDSALNVEMCASWPAVEPSRAMTTPQATQDLRSETPLMNC